MKHYNKVFPLDSQNYDAVCVVFSVPRSSVIMIPAVTSCPSSFNNLCIILY